MPMNQQTSRDRQETLQVHHQKTLWVYMLIILTGLWLISSPFMFGYTKTNAVTNRTIQITQERQLAPIPVRTTEMMWSDIASGAFLVLLGALMFFRRRLWPHWAASLVGVWLLLAPLVFWSPSAAAYIVDSSVGALIIALSILIPGIPGEARITQPGPEIPPGWSYNPSAWFQRTPIIALGWLAFFLARYMAAYQLGYIAAVWDPFFADGTMRILDSQVSRSLPISDAGLGSVAYILEALMGCMGGTQRWRTTPWTVTFFGILVVPLGVTSITLVVLQPVVVGTWCTLCLTTALSMLIMIALTLDEVVAMCQFLVQRTRQGKPFFKTFFLGETIEGGAEDKRSPQFTASLNQSAKAMFWGMTVPWNLLGAILLGALLMALPDILGTHGLAADSDHLAGALVVTVSIISMAEVGRALRFLNIPLGIWFILSPWLLSGSTTTATWSNILIGALLIILSLRRGSVEEHYGGWDRYIM